MVVPFASHKNWLPYLHAITHVPKHRDAMTTDRERILTRITCFRSSAASIEARSARTGHVAGDRPSGLCDAGALLVGFGAAHGHHNAGTDALQIGDIKRNQCRSLERARKTQQKIARSRDAPGPAGRACPDNLSHRQRFLCLDSPERAVCSSSPSECVRFLWNRSSSVCACTASAIASESACSASADPSSGTRMGCHDCAPAGGCSRAHQEDWRRRGLDDRIGDAAEPPALETAITMGCHSNQLGLFTGGDRHDLLSRVTRSHVDFDVESALSERQRGEIALRALYQHLPSALLALQLCGSGRTTG